MLLHACICTCTSVMNLEIFYIHQIFKYQYILYMSNHLKYFTIYNNREQQSLGIKLIHFYGII